MGSTFPTSGDGADPDDGLDEEPEEQQSICVVCEDDLAGRPTSQCDRCGRPVHSDTCIIDREDDGTWLCNDCLMKGLDEELDEEIDALLGPHREDAAADEPGADESGRLHIDPARVSAMVGQVRDLLRTISGFSFSYTYDEGARRSAWLELELIGVHLNAMGGAQLQRDVINEVRREHTELSRNLEVMWLGENVRRLP